MSERIHVKAGNDTSYDIVLDKSFDNLSEELIKVGLKNRKICIITDDHVSEFYLEKIYDICLAITDKVQMIAIPAGEENKNLATVNRIYEALIRHEFDRHDYLIALGGGVVGDITGFAAATYLRGISFVQIPTSLLAQVDSSIGGKTGVDFNSYKNMVGAFHMPELVYVNVATLNTLPKREISSGMGEIIKHGLIRDAKYYEWLDTNSAKILSLDTDTVIEMIKTSELIKKKVVEDDPHEDGVRGILNFGHTLGHAVEKEMNFTLSHGACVALGMVCAMKLCENRGYVEKGSADKLKKLLSKYDIPTSISGCDMDTIIKDTKNDKKMDDGHIKFVLLKSIGDAYIDKTVSDTEMYDALKEIYEKQ